MMILIVEGHYWSKGKDRKEARKLFKESKGLMPTSKASVYEVPDDYYIDEFGCGHGSDNAKLISGKDIRN